MRPLVFIPLPYPDLNMEQATRLAAEIESYLVDGYGCGVEHDALGTPKPTCVIIYLKDK